MIQHLKNNEAINPEGPEGWTKLGTNSTMETVQIRVPPTKMHIFLGWTPYIHIEGTCSSRTAWTWRIALFGTNFGWSSWGAAPWFQVFNWLPVTKYFVLLKVFLLTTKDAKKTQCVISKRQNQRWNMSMVRIFYWRVLSNLHLHWGVVSSLLRRMRTLWLRGLRLILTTPPAHRLQCFPRTNMVLHLMSA